MRNKFYVTAVFILSMWATAHAEVTELPPGPYGGQFRDDATGKIWLDYNTVPGDVADKLAYLAQTPYRLATTAELQALLNPTVLADPAVGPNMMCLFVDPTVECKYGVFDDSATGANPNLLGMGFGIVGADSVTIRNDGADDFSAGSVGAWAIQRAPTLRASNPYSLDFDGDSKDEKVVWRRATGEYFVRFSGSNEVLSVQWGFPGDVPIVGDYDGDRIPDLAVFRPSTAYWYILSSINLYSRSHPLTVQFGLPGDTPLRVDNDGDGRLDVTVWRNRDGNYYYIKSSNAQFMVEQWGLPGDVPINSVR